MTMKASRVILLYCVLIGWKANYIGVCGTFVSSVNYHFEAFNPYSLVRFFEFSDKGWLISENCLKDMYAYVEGLRHGAIWAAKLYDANGYYGGGGFNGSTIRIHNPNICRVLRKEYIANSLSKEPKFSINRTVIPFAVQTIVGKYQLGLTNFNKSKLFKIQQLICFPRSCSNKDLQQILEIHLFQRNLFVQNVSYIDHRILNDEHNIYNEMDFYALLILLVGSQFIYILVWLAEKLTVLINTRATNQFICKDLFSACLVQNQKYAKSIFEGKIYNFSISPTVVQFEKFLEAISLKGIVKDIFNEPGNATGAMSVCFAVLFVYAHVATEVAIMSNNMDFNKLQATNFILKNYSYIVDVYFFLSGVKLAHQFSKTFPSEKLNVFNQTMHLLKLIIQKLTSITPSYTFCLFAAYLVDKHLQNSIAIEIPSLDYRNCLKQKLSNLFYVDTFYPLTNRCMPWTWLVSLEVQFFIIACLILLLAEINNQYAALIGFGIYAVSTLAATFWEMHKNQNQSTSLQIQDELVKFNLVFDNICLRILPYVVGNCMGKILFRTDAKIKMNIYLFLSGWSACILMLGFFCYGNEQISDKVNRLTQAFLATMAHTMWVLILTWTLLTAISQYGAYLQHLLNFKYATTLEALAPINLMITPIIIRLYVFTSDAPIYTSQKQIFVMSVGCLLSVYACAFIMHVLLDGPLKAALKATLWKIG